MWVETLKLTNFGIHRELLIRFEPGLNIFRAANEAGKSTAILGLSYCWFGAGVLPVKIDDVVSWGAKKSAMQVETTLVRGETRYRCTRGTSGAELYENDTLLVTGHSEVTAKMEVLLGVPAGKAEHIVIANQNEIRGVLSMRPTAAAEFIEKLGDFGAIDRIVAKLTDAVPTGSTKALEEQVELVSATLLRLQGQEVIDTKAIEACVQGAVSAAAAAHTQEAAAGDYYRAEATRIGKLEAERSVLCQAITKLEQEDQRQRQQIKTWEEAVATGAGASKQIARIEAALLENQRCDAYALWTQLPPRESIWDESEEALLAAIAAFKVELRQSEIKVNTFETEIVGLQKQKITERVCPTCKRPFDAQVDKDEVNTRLDADIQAKVKLLNTARDHAVRAKDELREHQIIAIRTQQVRQALSKIDQFVAVDNAALPPLVTWRGAVPVRVGVSEQALQRWLKLQAEGEQARQQLAQLQPVSATGLEHLKTQLARLQTPDPGYLQDLKSAHDATVQAFRDADAKLLEEKRALDVANAQNTYRTKQILDQQQTLAQLSDAIRVQQENNALIKAAKDARLLVTEALWNKVTTTISAYFSKFRGRPSTVTRTPQGFAVDGRMSRSSGSTLDILGLAARVAVTKLFSACPICILDEPSAGCDTERTALMTGTLASCGFSQILMVTHKDIDEAGAARIITL